MSAKPANEAVAQEKVAAAQTQSVYDYRSHGKPANIIDAKHFSTLALVGLCYCILNSWTAASASLSVALPSGGPVGILWGLVVATFGTMAIALSMAEICHVYPTTGGQYHWAFALAPSRFQYSIAYFTGWTAVAGWVALTATASSLAGQLVTGIIALMNPGYTLEAWHIFLVYVAFAIGAWFINAFGVKLLDTINRVAMFWSLIGALVIMITCLARASPDFGDPKFVFDGYNNTTGWNDGVAWILGLLQASFCLIGADGATHMIDEIDRPSINAPRAMVLAVAIGASSTFVVLTTLLFVLNDFEAAISSASGALLEIIYQAVRNKAAAVCLLMFPVCSMAFTATALLTTSSRMVQSFARDKGLPFDRLFSRITGEVPIPAMSLTTVWVIVFGCIYLGSSSALNAILSSSVVLLQFSYIVPILLLLIRGRKVLDQAHEHRTLSLGVFGPAINVIAILYALFTNVFFLFPSELPVTGINMNYTIVVVAIVIIFSVVGWMVQGRKTYKGPLDMDEILFRTRGLQGFEKQENIL